MKITTLARAAAGLSGLLVLSACTGGAPADDDSSGDGDSAAKKPITYVVFQPEAPEDLKKIEDDIAAFSESSGIEVTVEALPVEELRTVIQPQLLSGEGPDVFQYDTGPGYAGVLSEAGLLHDLTEASADWGIYDWAQKRVTFDGKVVGIPDQVEAIGVYYNKDLFAEKGLEPPTSIDDLRAVSDKLKADGITPIAFGDKEGWEGFHQLSMGLASRVGSERMNAMVEGAEPWDNQDVVDTIDLFFGEFNEAGYLPKSPVAIDYDTGNSLFYSGKAAMLPTGTWLVSDITSSADFEVGFMAFPGPDGPGILTGGLGGGTFMSAKTDAVDESLELLNYLTSAERGQWQVSNLKTIPAFAVDTSGVEADALFKQVLDATAEISAGTADFGVNIDVLMSEQFNDAMLTGFQAILTGDATADEVAAKMQEASKK